MLYARGMGYYRDILTANKDPSPLKIRTWIRSSRSAKVRPVPLLPRIRSRATIRPELLEPKLELRENTGNSGSRIILLFGPPTMVVVIRNSFSRKSFRGISSRPGSGKKESFGVEGNKEGGEGEKERIEGGIQALIQTTRPSYSC